MKDTIVETAMQRWKLANDAENELRREELDDIRFSIGGESQWPAEIFKQRSSESRPSLVDDRLNPAIRQVTNDQRQNRPSLKIIAVDDTTEDTAQVWEGLVRHIQNDSNADIAFDTATDFQVRGGRGYIRVITEFEDDLSMDQVIKVKPVKNPFTVYFDPTAVEYDYSDAKWCFVTSDIPKDEYKENYGGTLSLMSVGDQQQDWINDKYIRVAEYFEVIEHPITIYQISNGQTLPDGKTSTVVNDKSLIPEGFVVIKERPSVRREIIWRMINGYEVLETKNWPGKYIPIIPVLGEQYDIDGQRIIKGMVRNAKDPQRMVNYWTSSMTEAIALAPKAPFIMAEGQDEGYEDEWRQANVKSYPRLIYRPVSLGGQNAPPPQRQVAEPPIQAMTMALRQAIDSVKATTGIYDPSLGGGENDQSGRAIIARQKEGDVSNLHFQDNLARSIRFLGVILIDLIPKIYDAQRVIRIVHADQTSEMVPLNTPHADANGVMQMFDMTNGKFDITVDVGPSYNTKRQEAAASMIDFIQAFPQSAPLIGDLVAKSLDWPDAQAVADRLHMMLPPELQDNNAADIPPQIKAQMGQMSQMVQMLTKALHDAQDKLDQKTVEANTKITIADMNNRAGITEALINQKGAVNQQFVDHQLGMIDKRVDMYHDDFAAQRDNAMQQQNAAQQAQLNPPQQDSAAS